jgi:hypothetical protein
LGWGEWNFDKYKPFYKPKKTFIFFETSLWEVEKENINTRDLNKQKLKLSGQRIIWLAV